MNRLTSPLLSSWLRPRGCSGCVLVMPYFVAEGSGVARPVASMPGVSQLSVDRLVSEVQGACAAGLRAVILFGIPALKDSRGQGAYDPDGIVPRAVRALKKEIKGLVVITDVCLCEYTSHGHCGILRQGVKPAAGRDFIDLKGTLELLARTALAHAQAGADMVAPSSMMRGQVGSIRRLLDKAGHKSLPIMAYSAKFASAFYGPFRDAAESAPQFGDRTGYQLSPLDAREALKRVAEDVRQGADIVMVKPGLPYLDILRQMKDRCRLPLAVYHVSGEYAMLKAASANGWLDEQRCLVESLQAFKRAGADIVITYYAARMAAAQRTGG